jgi:aryl carrier-like protein
LRVDRAALSARTDEIPALLRGLVPTVRRRGAATSVDATSLRQRLSGASDAEQELALRGLILEQAATLLGYHSPDELDPERDFLESGFDSLSAMELRNGLMAAIGLRLSPMVVFDNKNPAELARVLRAELAAAGDTPPPAANRPGGQTLREMFHGAVTSGKVAQGFTLLQAVADIRPSYASPDDLDRVPSAVRLSDGTGPRLICLSTPMVTGGIHQHARLVSHLQGRRQVSALPVSGFVAGESLPESPEAAISVIARGVLDAAEGEPFVLLGYSSGGTLACGAAGYLEQRLGIRPAGVIMLDTFKVHGGDEDGVPMDDLALGIFDKEAAFGEFDDARLSAMGRWVELVPKITCDPVEAPVLFVQCTESLVDGGEAKRAQAYEPTHTVRTVRANHFTLVEDRAEETASVIEDWLSGELG